MPHQIEQLYGKTIAIPDKAFEKLFEFFDAYHWHLDERPLKADNEINPDVLGYIFEKYINQKQMGAYYTKEDITDYISRTRSSRSSSTRRGRSARSPSMANDPSGGSSPKIPTATSTRR